FLIETGEVACAQDYIVERHDQLDGDQYYYLPPLAEDLEAKGLYLAAVVIYRALLEANLARALSKYYSHGVRYLRKLDALSGQVSDWKGIEPHAGYVRQIKHQHGRKPSFWGKYEQKERRLVRGR
ncbi:MAG TPA: hypothetical protein PLX96_05280, partial [Candidatus Omnitrophota bacterium]|nr:hypothetical protein [Candidatus Omnitrophota bacterium]